MSEDDNDNNEPTKPSRRLLLRANRDMIQIVMNNYIETRRFLDHQPKPGDLSPILETLNGKEFIDTRATEVFQANTNSAANLVSSNFFTEIEESYNQFLIFASYVNTVRQFKDVVVVEEKKEDGEEAEKKKVPANPCEKYRSRIMELAREAPKIGEELYQICFSLFLHITIRFFDAGYTEKAQKFLVQNHSRYKRPHQMQLIASFQQSMVSGELTKTLKNFRIAKVRIFITEQTFELLKEWLTTERMLCTLQILNTNLDFRIMSSDQYLISVHGRKELARIVPFKRDPTAIPNPLEAFLPSSTSEVASPELAGLLQVIGDVRCEPEARPGLKDLNVCQFGFKEDDICSVAVSRGLEKIAVGKENSEIWLWDFELVDQLQYYSARVNKHWSRIPVRRVADEVDFKFINYKKIAEEGGRRVPEFVEEFDSDDDEDGHHHLPSSMSPQVLRGHCAAVYDLAHYAPSNLLISCSHDTTIRSWDCNSGSCLAIYEGHPGPVWSVHLNDSGSFVSGGKNGAGFLWDITRTVPLRICSAGHLGDINCIRFHPNGNYIASGSSDTSVVLWDVHQMNQVRMFVGHRGQVRSLLFTKCGKFLATGSDDGTVKLWDISMGKCLQEFRAEVGEVPISMNSLALGKDDRLLAGTGPQMSGLYVWENPLVEGNFGIRPSKLPCIRLDSANAASSMLAHQFIREDLILAFSKPRSNRNIL